MSGFYAQRATFADLNPLLSLALGALSLRSRLTSLIEDAGASSAPTTLADARGIQFMLGLIAIAERIESYASAAGCSASCELQSARAAANARGSLLR